MPASLTPQPRGELDEARQLAIEKVLARVRDITQHGVDRSILGTIMADLKTLATRRQWWSGERFPPPPEPERQARYLISEDADHRFALYLNVMRPGKLIPPHNHTTWACIAAVEGAEVNRIYRRTDDGSRPGIGVLEEDHVVVVQPGMGVALMPDDIHSVQIEGCEVIRHLHLYGRALETLVDRVVFDLSAGTCSKMGIGVPTRRALAS